MRLLPFIPLLSLATADTCSYIQAQADDGCWSLAQRCGITQDQLTQYNTAADFCNTIHINDYVCCSAGSLPDFSPKPSADGTCFPYTIADGDQCSVIAPANFITVDQIESYNTATWGWTGCRGLQVGQRICLSSGSPPFPAPLQGAVCGPQKPGTTQPTTGSPYDWSWLNQCPLNACCDKWGQCGITPDFCTNTTAPGGAPGTSSNGTNGCISNCGTDIQSTDVAVETVKRIAYFENWNLGRPCANMDISKVTDGGYYTHVHWAFANITNDWRVDVSGAQDQFDGLLKLTGIKRIVSFGGWGFSTDSYTINIFRTGVLDGNRQTLAKNVAQFAIDNNLDGLDFDWEYPGAQDVGDFPDSPDSGKNYAAFLGLVRSALPKDKSISIALPASYWYLKGFDPLLQFEGSVDYYIYMTYDLHGQWDYNNTFANPGCPLGNCLRSHVNQTEIGYTLAMLTKAGIPSTRIVPGLPLYGRAFGMTDPLCLLPECTFTGPLSGAFKGNCTNTAGYLSNFEIQAIINKVSLGSDADAENDDDGDSTAANQDWTYYQYYDEGDVLIFEDTWISYLSASSYAARRSWFDSLHLAGSVDWAIDLNNSYTGNGTGVLTDGDEDGNDDWGDFSCPSATYGVLEDLQNAQGSIPAHCLGRMALNTLETMLDTAYNNYTNVNNGYDAAFGYYVTYMNKLIPEILVDAFMFNMSTTGPNAIMPDVGFGMLSFDCTLPNGKKIACKDISVLSNAQNMEQGGTTTMTLRDKDGYNAALVKAGLDPDWVTYGDYTLERDITAPHASRKFLIKFSGFPVQNKSMSVPNPKDIVTKGLGDIPGLKNDMINSGLDLAGGMWLNGSYLDPAQVYSAPVFLLMQAVDGMATAKQLGQQEEKTEAEAERKRRENLILTILSVVFLVVPFIGEEAALAAGLGTLARSLALAGEVGNAALALYDTVKDPSSALLNVIGILMGVGAFAKATRDGKGFAPLAGLRKGMKPDDTKAFGTIFQDKDTLLQGILKKACK